MGYDKIAGCGEGAILILANNYKEAKQTGYESVMELFGSEYIDIGIKLLKGNNEHLFVQADQNKLLHNIPHFIDDLETCSVCGMWNAVIGEDGCTNCS